MRSRLTRRWGPGLMLATLLVGSGVARAQEGKPPVDATDILKAAIAEAAKKGHEALKPGVTVNDRLFSLTDIGKYNVAVAYVTRPGGKAAGTRSLSHDKVTEIYYMLRGSGTQVIGTLTEATHSDGSTTIGPGFSSEVLPKGRSVRLTPGEMQVVPPGVGHGWGQIDEGGIDYLIFRIDPAHVLKMQ
jgi:mannose-6-phosphate isomerase-like protein (cupin superfamily)